MAVLLIRKRAVKTGKEPAEGEAWPLDYVELQSEVPDEMDFSDGFVDDGVRLGWIEFAGKPLSYTVTPDPLGDFKYMGDQVQKLPGNQLVLHLVKDGEKVDVTYDIIQPPVPRAFRVADDTELSGFRSNQFYKCALKEVSG